MSRSRLLRQAPGDRSITAFPIAAFLTSTSAAGIGLTRELIAAERKFIHVLLRDGKITDEIRRRIERDLDLEEASLANREYRRTPL